MMRFLEENSEKKLEFFYGKNITGRTATIVTDSQHCCNSKTVTYFFFFLNHVMRKELDKESFFNSFAEYLATN